MLIFREQLFDDGGAPLALASVSVAYSGESDTWWSCETDENGWYEINFSESVRGAACDVSVTVTSSGKPVTKHHQIELQESA